MAKTQTLEFLLVPFIRKLIFFSTWPPLNEMSKRSKFCCLLWRKSLSPFGRNLPSLWVRGIKNRNIISLLHFLLHHRVKLMIFSFNCYNFFTRVMGLNTCQAVVKLYVKLWILDQKPISPFEVNTTGRSRFALANSSTRVVCLIRKARMISQNPVNRALYNNRKR